MPSMSRSQMKKQADRDFMLSLLGSLMQGANAYGNYRQGNRQLDLQQQEQDAVQGRFDANMAYQKEQDAFNRAPATLPEMFAGNDWITNQDKSWAFPLLSGKQMDQQRLDQAHSQWAQEFGFNQDQANLDELFRQGQQGRSIELLNLEHQLRMQEMAQQYENQLGLKLMEGMGQPGDVAGLDFTVQKNVQDMRDYLTKLATDSAKFNLGTGESGPDPLSQLASIPAFLGMYDFNTLNNPDLAAQLDQTLTLALNKLAPRLAGATGVYDPNSGNPMTPEQEQYVQNLKYLQSIGQMIGGSGLPGYTDQLLSQYEPMMGPQERPGTSFDSVLQTLGLGAVSPAAGILRGVDQMNPDLLSNISGHNYGDTFFRMMQPNRAAEQGLDPISPVQSGMDAVRAFFGKDATQAPPDTTGSSIDWKKLWEEIQNATNRLSPETRTYDR